MKRPGKKSPGPLEIELKFQLSSESCGLLEASAAFTAVKAKQLHQITTYFDTPNHVLDSVGLTLRVRESGDAWIQTVKSRPSGYGVAATRKEWEWPISGCRPELGCLAAVPELANLGHKIAGNLEPLFATDILRTIRVIRLSRDTLVEAAIDIGRIDAGGKSEPVSELELELKVGKIAPMYQLAADLQLLAPFWISTESKSERGWHLLTGRTDAARDAEILKLGRRVQAADGLRHIIGATLGHMMANIGPARRGDPEGVHQMRLALRGARASLKLFSLHLAVIPFEHFDNELQGFGRIFGAARDWDVFCLETLPSAEKKVPGWGMGDLRRAAERERLRAHAKVLDTLLGQAFTALLLDLTIWTQASAAQASRAGDKAMDKRLGDISTPLLEAVAAKAMRRGRHAGRLSEEKLHRFRKSLDKLCDDVKSLAGLYSSAAVKAYRDRCEDVQAILGRANDAAVTKQLSLKLASENGHALTEPAQALARWSDHRRRKILRELKAALEDFRAAPLFWS